MHDTRTTIYVDCTATEMLTINTGIQRVVRNIIARTPDVERRFDIRCVPTCCALGRLWTLPARPATGAADDHRSGGKASGRPSLLVRLSGMVSILLDRSDKAAGRLAQRWVLLRWLPRPISALRRAIRFAGYAAFQLPFLLKMLTGRIARIRPRPGDIVLLPDSFWAYDIVAPLRRRLPAGVIVIPVIHDLIPINNPEYCSDDFVRKFKRLLDALIPISAGFITVSATTRAALQAYMRTEGHAGQAERPALVAHLGSDIRSPDAAPASPAIRPEVRDLFTRGGAVFLMVGTIEPRKGHDLVFDAMSAAWDAGSADQLIIVGRIGWLCEALIARMKASPHYRRLLHIYHDINDDELDFLYRRATALIFASRVEGFGLPLVEAMQSGLPVLASDIPIFHEIGQDYPVYFDLADRADLLRRIEQIKAPVSGQSMSPRRTGWQTWDEAVSTLYANALEIAAQASARQRSD